MDDFRTNQSAGETDLILPSLHNHPLSLTAKAYRIIYKLVFTGVADYDIQHIPL